MSPPQFQLDNADSLLLSLLTSIAFAVRFWRIFYPLGVVFDEVYFGNFSNFYTFSEFYYDIHPPLAKIIPFLIANLSEYNGTLRFYHCPEYAFGDYVQLRITPAFFSALCGPLAYLAVRFARFGHTAGTVSAILLIFDTSLGVEGRHILSDGILHFFSVLHVVILMHSMSLQLNSKKFIGWHIATGISLAAACSCKNTAWGLIAMDGFCYAIRFIPVFKIGIFDYLFELFIWGITLAIILGVLYLLIFSLHFILLPFSGPGNGYLDPVMKAQLLPKGGVALWGKRLSGPGLFWRSITLSIKMHRGNMGIQSFHDSMSFPQQWPLLRGIMTYFWGSKWSGNSLCRECVFSLFCIAWGDCYWVWFPMLPFLECFAIRNWLGSLLFSVLFDSTCHVSISLLYSSDDWRNGIRCKHRFIHPQEVETGDGCWSGWIDCVWILVVVAFYIWNSTP
jgi:dolichyl-phosphate-mannose--protein O-mannosyl transferase